jgi:CheY-like chemotaxis protein/HD-like signal output (HDOD) protein
MANVLFLDDNDVAGRAMHSILGRGNHMCVVAKDVATAWRTLRGTVGFDLVITEVRLNQGDGLTFVQRLRDDWFFHSLPVIVYTGENDLRFVRRALALDVQNYLLKPYDDRAVQAEIARAMGRNWRAGFFEEPKAWSARLNGLSLSELPLRRWALQKAFAAAALAFPGWAAERDQRQVLAEIDTLAETALEAGFLGVADGLKHLREAAETENWASFEACGEPLEYASRVLRWELEPSSHIELVEPVETKGGVREQTERAIWEAIDAPVTAPVLKPEGLFKEIDALSGCPVASGSAAAFQMMASGRFEAMSRMMDLVTTDPGLAAQVLGAANRDRRDDTDEIDDPGVAAGRLGEAKLAALARSLPLAEERHLELAPLNWPGYWVYQAAVGRVAQYVCKYLEINFLTESSGTAGLLHDLGKLLLLKLHPHALRAVVRRARETKRPLADVERELIGCTTRDLAIHFAEHQHLPSAFCSVIRWIDSPALAVKDMDLVAIVAVARHLVGHARVGTSVESPIGVTGSVVATPAWKLLEPRLFPSFDSRKFEAQAHAFCLTVRNELVGRINETRQSHAQRAAQLV